VALGEFVFWPHVQHDGAIHLHALQQLLQRHGLQPLALAQAVGDHGAHFCMAIVQVAVQGGDDAGDGAGTQPVQHMLSFPPREHHAGALEVLQVLRGVGHGQAAQFGQPLHGLLPLYHMVQQGQAVGVPQGAGQFGQVREGLMGHRAA
jgi:hypothetical protein